MEKEKLLSEEILEGLISALEDIKKGYYVVLTKGEPIKTYPKKSGDKLKTKTKK